MLVEEVMVDVGKVLLELGAQRPLSPPASPLVRGRRAEGEHTTRSQSTLFASIFGSDNDMLNYAYSNGKSLWLGRLSLLCNLVYALKLYLVGIKMGLTKWD